MSTSTQNAVAVERAARKAALTAQRDTDGRVQGGTRLVEKDPIISRTVLSLTLSSRVRTVV